MYTYKRFRASKSPVVIILIALALLAWSVLGPTGTPLAKKDGGDGKETATFELTYSDDSDLGFTEGTVSVTKDISPGTQTLSVLPHGPNQLTRALRMPFFPICIMDCIMDRDDSSVGITYIYMFISLQKNEPARAIVQFWFNALPEREDGSFVRYELEMHGEIDGEWLPTEGGTTTIIGLGDWKLSAEIGKDRDALVDCSTTSAKPGDAEAIEWDLNITRLSE